MEIRKIILSKHLFLSWTKEWKQIISDGEKFGHPSLDLLCIMTTFSFNIFLFNFFFK